MILTLCAIALAVIRWSPAIVMTLMLRQWEQKVAETKDCLSHSSQHNVGIQISFLYLLICFLLTLDQSGGAMVQDHFRGSFYQQQITIIIWILCFIYGEMVFVDGVKGNSANFWFLFLIALTDPKDNSTHFIKADSEASPATSRFKTAWQEWPEMNMKTNIISIYARRAKYCGTFPPFVD